jgi:aminopeptidase N
MAPKAVEFMEQFTHYPFMLEKLDQIAISDFASGGMENWGLITYR